MQLELVNGKYWRYDVIDSSAICRGTGVIYFREWVIASVAIVIPSFMHCLFTASTQCCRKDHHVLILKRRQKSFQIEAMFCATNRTFSTNYSKMGYAVLLCCPIIWRQTQMAIICVLLLMDMSGYHISLMGRDHTLYYNYTHLYICIFICTHWLQT
jgi:hypothetical protein